MFRIFVISLLAFMSSAFADCAVDQFLQSGTCVSCPANSTSDGGNVSSCTCNPGFSVDGTPSGSSVTTSHDCVFAPKFFVTVTLGSANKFEFKISAAGNFYIDWGDNSPIKSIEGKGTTNTAYSHSYAAGTYTIGITGDVTAYNASTTTAAIDFGYNSTYKKYLTGISGSLGALFPTLANGSQPVFYKTFYGCSVLNGPIPENLFDGIHGDTVPNMFRSTFENCSSLDGPLPTDLFSGLTGTPAQDSFKNTLKKTLVTGTVTTALFGDMDITTGGNNLDGMFNGVTTLNTTCPDGSASISNVTDATICEASTTTEPEVCEPGYWLNGDNCELCPEGFYCADNAQLVCDPEYPMSAPGASQATECYKNCTAECTPTCPSNASCTHETSDTAGIEYFGGMCDAPESACEIITITCEPGYILKGDVCEKEVITCETGYWLNGDECELCPAGSFCANNKKSLCNPEFPDSVPGSNDLTDCYKSCTAECTPTCPSNATCTHEITSNTGIQYYGEECNAAVSACQIISVACNDGFEMVDGVCKSTMDAEFIITTTELSDGATFSFSISAAGTYYIDCDDGKGVQVKEKTNTNMATYTCSYAKGGVKHIGLSGQATQYHSGSSAAISFSGNKSLAGISGSLGAIFSTLPDGSNPKFYQTFNLCTSLQGVIPQNLFKGIYGAASEAMFRSTFEGCSGLTGTLPDGMFADITGGDAKYLFYNTFYKCSGLQGSIPSNMFAGISGNFTSSMFAGTFRSCSGLTGYIPYNLFANINASSYRSGMLKQIFEGTGLDTSCPVNTYQFITGFEDDFSSKVACAPCPDGGQSPAGSTSVEQCTGGTVVCLEGEYKNEDDVCVDCPVDKPYSLGGATDVRMCFASEIRKLHVGDALIGLLRNQQTTPALHVKIDNVVYYGALTDQETVMSPESNKKLKVRLNNIIYYLYDQTRMLDL